MPQIAFQWRHKEKPRLARSLTIAEVGASRGLSSHRHLDFLGQRFRECLETLAVEFGYAMTQR
jgi:hypothetical protein